MKKPVTIQDYLIPYVNHEVYFNDPVIVKDNNMSLFECWGVASHEGIWLMDEQGKWYKWQPCDQNAQLVKEAVETRLMMLKRLKQWEIA